MLVSADLYNNYLFEPTYDELNSFLRVFKGLVTKTANGYTSIGYTGFNGVIIKDQVYSEIVADKTRSFDTIQEQLTYLQLTPNLATGEILQSAGGLVLPTTATFSSNKLGFTTNHIPQLLARLPRQPEQFITSFNGEYSFKSKLFRGMIEYKELSEIWSA